jgi:GNAT superfamily N-acetyltransferase
VNVASSSDVLRIRPLSGEDRAALAELPKRISAESAISRFHGGVTMLTDSMLDRLLDIEVGRHEAFIALDDRGIAGVARYARDETDPTTTEVAILVADEWQHGGVTRKLMRPLMTGARDAGINGFEPRSSRRTERGRSLGRSCAGAWHDTWADGSFEARSALNWTGHNNFGRRERFD